MLNNESSAEKAISILTDAIDSIAHLLLPIDFRTNEDIKKAHEIKKAVREYREKQPLKPKSHTPQSNIMLETHAADAFQKAIQYAGNAFKLSKLCKIRAARIYDITGGRVRVVSHGLARQIEEGTKGHVKMSDLIEKEVDKVN